MQNRFRAMIPDKKIICFPVTLYFIVKFNATLSAFLPHYTINKSLWFSSPSDAEPEKLCSTKNVATSDMLFMKDNNDDDDSGCQLPSFYKP